MTKTTDGVELPQRPLLHRLLHALAEAVGILALGASLVMVGTALLCLNNRHCNNMGGIVFFIATLLVALIGCSAIASLLAKYRNRLDARKKVDIAIGVATLFLWALYFYYIA